MTNSSKQTTQSRIELFNTKKRDVWNNKRRYAFLTHYKFI